MFGKNSHYCGLSRSGATGYHTYSAVHAKIKSFKLIFVRKQSELSRNGRHSGIRDTLQRNLAARFYQFLYSSLYILLGLEIHCGTESRILVTGTASQTFAVFKFVNNYLPVRYRKLTSLGKSVLKLFFAHLRFAGKIQLLKCALLTCFSVYIS